jgi:hypothetical protein
MWQALRNSPLEAVAYSLAGFVVAFGVTLFF